MLSTIRKVRIPAILAVVVTFLVRETYAAEKRTPLTIFGGPSLSVSSDASIGPALTFGEIPTARVIRSDDRIGFAFTFASLATGRAAEDRRVRSAFALARLQRATVAIPMNALLTALPAKPNAMRTKTLVGRVTIGGTTRTTSVIVEVRRSWRTTLNIAMSTSIVLADFGVRAIPYRDASIAGITIAIGFEAT